jgi:hypothetical protein
VALRHDQCQTATQDKEQAPRDDEMTHRSSSLQHSSGKRADREERGVVVAGSDLMSTMAPQAPIVKRHGGILPRLGT